MPTRAMSARTEIFSILSRNKYLNSEFFGIVIFCLAGSTDEDPTPQRFIQNILGKYMRFADLQTNATSYQEMGVTETHMAAVACSRLAADSEGWEWPWPFPWRHTAVSAAYYYIERRTSIQKARTISTEIVNLKVS